MVGLLKHIKKKETIKERCHEKLVDVVKQQSLLVSQYLNNEMVNKNNLMLNITSVCTLLITVSTCTVVISTGPLIPSNISSW